MGEQTT
ncbi:hypothetical protein D018_0598A, partial [Vibrio parahaemolyticus VP2007-007]